MLEFAICFALLQQKCMENANTLKQWSKVNKLNENWHGSFELCQDGWMNALKELVKPKVIDGFIISTTFRYQSTKLHPMFTNIAIVSTFKLFFALVSKVLWQNSHQAGQKQLEIGPNHR